MAPSKYDKNFYSENQNSSYKAASKIVPLVNQLFPSNSVVDVGCGSGGWLKAFYENGSSEILGLDGEWLERESLLIDPVNFEIKNLTVELGIKKRFDIALSLEVAEHIEEKFADTFLREITKLSDVVLFSAAIPHQGGTLHVNEQWQSWWAQKFIDFGYTPIDCLRHKIWCMDDVAFWYKQNLLIYIENERLGRGDLDELLPYVASKRIMDIVHPHLYKPKAKLSEKLNKYVPNILKKIFT